MVYIIYMEYILLYGDVSFKYIVIGFSIQDFVYL